MKTYEARIRFTADSFTIATRKLAGVKRVLKRMSEVMGLRMVIKTPQMVKR